YKLLILYLALGFPPDLHSFPTRRSSDLKENLSFGLLYRKQWVDIEDAPTTATFSGSSPVGKNVGLGLSVINDEIGPVKETNVYADRKSTRLNSSHVKISYAVFCLKKKKN